MGHDAKFPILSRLRGLKWTDNNGQGEACCPAHEDSRPSLMVNAGGPKLLFECRAGCDVVDILRAIGAKWSDIFETTSDPAKAAKNWQDRIVATYDYRDETGTLLFQVCRIEPGDDGRKKDFRQRRPLLSDDGKPIAGKWEWKVKGTRHVLYRLPELLAADPSRPVLICEGEKDADRLAKIGLVVTTNPGGADAKKNGEGKWHDDYSDCLKGRKVYILVDNDAPGRRHADRVAKSLQGKSAEVHIVQLPGLPEKGDASDWLDTKGLNHTPAELIAELEKAPLWDASGSLSKDDAADKSDEKPNESDADPHRLAKVFVAQNTVGGRLTIRFWRGVWYRWRDGYYEPIDNEETRCRVVTAMKVEFDRINVERLKNWVPESEGELPPHVIPVTVTATGSVMQALRSICLLSSAIEPPAILDEHDVPRPAKHLISLRNGVFDLRKFLADEDDVMFPHSPTLFTLAALPIEFNIEAECPRWRAFLSRNLNNDDRADMLQEWFGVCATFNNSFQSFLMMEGSGSNGKSVICSALTAFLGLRNVSHVPLECFGETFHLSGTVGKLANIVSEIGEVEKANEGTLKSYTSGDRMTFNRKNLPLFEAVPTARLVMATNALPRFADRSNGVWRRMLLLPLDVVIGSSERVAGMDSSEWWSDQPDELAGMFLWALTGLARLMKPPHKFTQPLSSRAAVAEYQMDCFPARRFLDETYEVDPNGEVSTHEVYQGYKKWCDEHGNKPQASNTFAKEIKKVFPDAIPKRRVMRHDGKIGPGYTGIEFRNQADIGSEENQENEENNFSEILF